jgi:hypothetical protein
LDKSFYGDRPTDDTEANTIARPLYVFNTIVIIKEGRAKNTSVISIIILSVANSPLVLGGIRGEGTYIIMYQSSDL